MHILILGAGAIGGYFGARLQDAGGDITFLVRSARAAQLAARGLHVESPLGNVDVKPKAITAEGVHEHFDVAILTCKAYDLGSAVDSIAPFVGPDSVILPLLNGMAHLDLLDSRFGRDRVLGGVAHLAVTLTSEEMSGSSVPGVAAAANAEVQPFTRVTISGCRIRLL